MLRFWPFDTSLQAQKNSAKVLALMTIAAGVHTIRSRTVNDFLSDALPIAGTLIVVVLIGVIKLYRSEEGARQPANKGGTAQVVTNGGTAQTINKGGTAQVAANGKTTQATNTGGNAKATNAGKTTQATNTGKTKQATNNGKPKKTTNNGKTGQATNTGNIALAMINEHTELVTNTGNTEQAGTEVVALLFLPPGQRTNLHAGEPVKVSLGSATSSYTGSIESVESGVLSPSDIRTRFNLQGAPAQTISGPSAVITVRIGTDSSMHTYVGSLCHADIQIGSQSVLAMLPGLDQVSQLLDESEQFFQMLYGQMLQFLK